MPSITTTPTPADSNVIHPQPSTAPAKIPGQPAPDEDNRNLQDGPEATDGDMTNQPAYDKDSLRTVPAD